MPTFNIIILLKRVIFVMVRRHYYILQTLHQHKSTVFIYKRAQRIKKKKKHSRHKKTF